MSKCSCAMPMLIKHNMEEIGRLTLSTYSLSQITKLLPQPATRTSITWQVAGLSSDLLGSWVAQARNSGSSQHRQTPHCHRACTWARTGHRRPAGRRVCATLETSKETTCQAPGTSSKWHQ